MKTYNKKSLKMIRTHYVLGIPMISELNVIWYEKTDKVSVHLGIDESLFDKKEIDYIEGLSFNEAIDYLKYKDYIEVPDDFDRHEKDSFNLVNVDARFVEDFFLRMEID